MGKVRMNNTEEAHAADLNKKVRIYYSADNKPKNKAKDIEYIEVSSKLPLIFQVKKLEGSMKDKIHLQPCTNENGEYCPAIISRNDRGIAVTIIDCKDALGILGRKAMNEKALALVYSLLWGAGRKSFG